MGAYRRRSHRAPASSGRSGGRSDRFLGGKRPKKGAGKGVKRARGALGEGQDEGSRHLAGRASLPGPGEHLFRRLSVSHQEET